MLLQIKKVAQEVTLKLGELHLVVDEEYVEEARVKGEEVEVLLMEVLKIMLIQVKCINISWSRVLELAKKLRVTVPNLIRF